MVLKNILLLLFNCRLNSDNSQLTGNSSSDLNNNPESLTSIPAGGLEEIQRKLIQDDW